MKSNRKNFCKETHFNFLNKRDQRVTLLLALVLCCIASVVSAMTITDGSSDYNDRFANSSSFVADDYDMSGVGINNSGRWLTMLSQNVYISSNHFAPATGSSVTFYETNDPSGSNSTRTVSDTRQQVGETDLFLGTIDSALSSNFAYYDFATEDITTTTGNGTGSFNASQYNGANAYVVGRSPRDWPVSQNMAVGRNVLDLFWLDQSVEGRAETGDAIGATDDGTGGVTYEAMLQSGDSGGPLFVDDGTGSFTLVGVNWFVGTLTSGEDMFGATYLGNYDEDVQSFVDIYTIPEPTTGLTLIILGLCALHSRPRRRAAA